MIRTIIFDLSEVLIAGLIGIEKRLSEQLQMPQDTVLAAFGGALLEDLCRAEISEDFYLAQIIERQGWDVSNDRLKQVIRQNLHHRVPGMVGILEQLAPRYELILLSDHAAEWVAYVRSIHPWLEIFHRQIYSFETGQLKGDPSTFKALVEILGREPEECLFIDDSRRNVKSARAAGIASIRFIDRENLEQELKKYRIPVA